MKYIVGPKQPEDGCVFCRAPAEEDAVCHVLSRGEQCYVLLNKYPYNNGHLMVVPYRHVSALTELDRETLGEMMRLAADWTGVIAADMNAEGYNLGINLGAAAGAGIRDHVHLHLVPRWHGDTNFMPVVGDTKVMPEDLDATWKRLRAAWDRYVQAAGRE